MTTKKIKKRRFFSPNYPKPYPSSPQQVGKPTLSLQLKHYQRDITDLQLLVSPPIANTSEAVVSIDLKRKSRELSDNVLSEIIYFIRDENHTTPYTDSQICNHLKGLGYKIIRDDVALARHKLGIASSSRRY
ncbi:hypothetical protein J4406_02690 [Candidatus Woesearchaeota archaeon]|nr:hypothetical protein [Candidatus Woesearchaeota archaeon]